MNNNYMEPQNDIVMPTPNIISSPMEMNTQPMEQQFINPAPQMNMQQPVAEMPMGNTITNNKEWKWL